MSRRFTHQLNEQIRVAPGAIAGLTGNNMTVLVLWKPFATDSSGIVTGFNAADGHVWNVNPFSDGRIYFGASGFAATDPGTWAGGDGWRVDAFTHAGNNSTLISYKYLFSGGGWVGPSTSSSGNFAASAQGPNAYYLLGAFNSGEALNGWIGAIAVYPTVLSAAEIMTSSLESALAGWLALAPGALWKFNLDDVASGAVDMTGGGANEVSHSGTSFSTDEAAGFDFTLPAQQLTLTPATGHWSAMTVDPFGNPESLTLTPATPAWTVVPVRFPDDLPVPLATYRRGGAVLARRPDPVVATRAGTLVYRRE